jgi:hypothetical protein
VLLVLQTKPASEFHKSKSYKDGLFGQCKACCAAAAAKVSVTVQVQCNGLRHSLD